MYFHVSWVNRQVCQERKKMKDPGSDIYLETTISDVLLVPKGKYCLTCDPEREDVQDRNVC